MDEIKVSFVVPVYNVENYIAECLESILHQTLQEIEIIVVNDGTKDNSISVVRELQRKYSNIRIIDKENGGISSARNAGVIAAVGEYICFVDSDDFYNSADFAEIFYKQCKEKKLDIIRGWYGIFDDETKRYLPHPLPEITYWEQVLSGELFLCKSVDEHANEVVPWLGFFKREYLQKNQLLFPEGISYEEDQLFFLQALLCDPTCKILQSRLEFYAYRKRAGSATKTPTLKQAKNVMYVVNAENQLLDSLPYLSAAARKAAKRYICSSLYQLTSIYGRVSEEDRRIIARMVPFSIKMQCIRNPYDRHQQMKMILFTFARRLVDRIYERRNALC